MEVIKTVLLLIIISTIASAQYSEGMERLLYEFPHGRPAYSPLANEFEIAPRVDLWKNSNRVGAFYNLDMEYAISSKFILEAGVGFANTEEARPAFIQESGLELGGYYTLINHRELALTFGLESHFQLEHETIDPNKYSIEPMILAATAFNKFQIHLGINSEISSSTVRPGFFIGGIYSAGLMRPFVEILKPNEGSASYVITPGIVIPFYNDLHCGIGIPISNKQAGFTIFIAIEVGEEE
jgi:hypothetical protein